MTEPVPAGAAFAGAAVSAKKAAPAAATEPATPIRLTAAFDVGFGVVRSVSTSSRKARCRASMFTPFQSLWLVHTHHGTPALRRPFISLIRRSGPSISAIAAAAASGRRNPPAYQHM